MPRHTLPKLSMREREYFRFETTKWFSLRDYVFLQEVYCFMQIFQAILMAILQASPQLPPTPPKKREVIDDEITPTIAITIATTRIPRVPRNACYFVQIARNASKIPTSFNAPL